jgi:hypothetical protein
MHPSGGDLAQIAELIEQGKLNVIVDKAIRSQELLRLWPMSKVVAPRGKSLLR